MKAFISTSKTSNTVHMSVVTKGGKVLSTEIYNSIETAKGVAERMGAKVEMI